MVVEVYPIMRMPRHVSVFDYAVPEELHHLKRGDVVVIPFRQITVHGIVSRVKDVPERGFRLKSVLQKETRIHFSSLELSFFESLSIELLQSVSSLLYSSLPSFPKRLTTTQIQNPEPKRLTIPSHELSGLQSLAKQLSERSRAFASVSDIRRMTCVIAGFMRIKPSQKCIVLCPTVLDANRIYSYLPIESRFLLTGEENAGTQFAVWSKFKSLDSGVLIGTKNTLFATDEKTTSIFVLRSSHNNHGHHEQNPRFDARAVAKILSDHFKTNLFFLDVMPRIEDFFLFSKTNMVGTQANQPARLIDMEQQGRASKMGHWISHESFLATQELLEQNKRVLMVFNRKNHAKRLFCTACETDIKCMDCSNGMIKDDLLLRCVRCKRTEPLLRTCPTCGQATLRESGFGNQKIDTLLQEAFPSHQTCLIDKEHPNMNAHASLVIATSYYLEQMADAFSPDNFSLVVLLDADAPLFRSTYRASESALYECEGWRALAESNHAPFFLQTRSLPFFTEYYANPERVLTQELESRQSYQQPPFCEMITLRFEESEPRKADLLQNQLIQQIRSVSQGIRIKKEISQNKSEYGLEVRLSLQDRPKLLALFRALPDHVIIDTHANSG